MTTKPDKTRTNITFPMQLKEQLEQIAKQENRSFNNLVITVLQDFVKSADKQSVLFYLTVILSVILYSLTKASHNRS